MKRALIWLLLMGAVWGEGTTQDYLLAGNGHMKAKAYPAAIEQYRLGLKLDPKETSLLYNAGTAAYLSNDGETALSFWLPLKELTPEDWRLRGKLVQTYQLLNRPADRDRERAELLELRKKGAITELNKAPYFCRDQFLVERRRVYAYEFFDLKGAQAVRYLFVVSKPDSDEFEPYRMTLESDESDTQIARELKQIGPDQRIFSLDWTTPKEHRTYGIFNQEPDYEATRKLVVDALSGKSQPASSSQEAK